MEGEKKNNQEFLEQYHQGTQDGAPGDQPAINLESKAVDRRPLKEKLLSIGILAAAFIAVFLGYYQLAASVTRPFYNFESESPAAVSLDQGLADILALKQKDTDGDGLSDYDEIYIYGTSPYLADTDGDGVSDYDEIQMGRDPLCPGGTCAPSPTTDGDQSSVPTFQNFPTVAGMRLDVDFLRQLLIQAGAPADLVNEVSDSELLVIYQEVLAENPELANQLGEIAGTPTSGGLTPFNPVGQVDFQVNTIEDLQNLSADQIRYLLIQEGAPESMLNQISDEQLRQMFLSQLESQLTNISN